MSGYVSYQEMADRLGVDPSTVRRLLRRHGEELEIEVQKCQASTSNAKWAHFLTRDDADRLETFYREKRTSPSATVDPTAYQRLGFFYVIQLVPEALPNRIKIGYTDNMDQRLADHRTAAPTAKLLKSWPCKRSWDQAAMDSIAREQCKLVLNEVFEGDPAGFVARGDAFFRVMPEPGTDRPLSDHSPLNEPDDRNAGDDDGA